MSENEPSQVKRTGASSWYSVYQSQVVGEPKSLWAPEDPRKMSNGYDDDSVVRNGEEPTLDWNLSKDSDDWNHSKDSDDGKYSKDADDVKDGDEPHSNKFPGHAVTLENGNISSSSSSGHTLLRPLSMDPRLMEHEKDEVEPRVLQRSWSTIPNWNDYEEFKLPKRYQKPTNTKINTRLSRTYITGAGSDKCKKCGQRLYEMEKINANHSSYHRTCFQCSRCQRLLSLSTFISIDGQLYCNSHFLDIVNNKPNISETHQMSNAVEQKDPHQPDAQDIHKEVTLTSIADIKSRFEIPSNNQTESEKKGRNDEPQKILQLTEDVHSSVKAITSSMTRDVQVQHSKPTIKDSASSHDNMLFELKPEKTSSRHLKQDEEAFGTPQSTTSPPFIRDNDNDILPVADAFAKFKTMESRHMERIPSSEIKPVRKPVWDIKSATKGSLPQNREMGNHLSFYSDMQYAKPEEKLHAVSIQDPAIKNNMSPASKDCVNSEENRRAEVDPSRAHENDVPPVGITKQLVAQWKLMDTPDGIPLHRSHALVVSTPSPGGRSTTAMALDGSSKISNTITHHSLQLRNGFPATEAGSSYENTLEPVRKYKEIVPQDNKLRNNGVQETSAIAPLDFTRNQLAKFKELEAIAQKSTNPYPTPKKDFRWGVKEASPLHRPIAQASLPPAVWIGLKTDDYPAKLSASHAPLADQTDAAWNGLKRDDHHPAKPVATHTPWADQTDGTEQQPTLACMKEALAQFKSMEDLTRPPPNPVLALSKQKAATATHMKQYHDVIHVSYTMQTVKD